MSGDALILRCGRTLQTNKSLKTWTRRLRFPFRFELAFDSNGIHLLDTKHPGQSSLIVASSEVASVACRRISNGREQWPAICIDLESELPDPPVLGFYTYWATHAMALDTPEVIERNTALVRQALIGGGA